jgi:ATP/maltotriose-dependent transcriptional regulator MalT
VFLIGLEREDLDRLRLRSKADGGVEVVGAALLQDVESGAWQVPDAIDAIVMSPATWPRAAATISPARRDAGSENRLIEELTGRERDVLALVADGLPNRDVAARLGISEHTVKFHLASLFGKLGVSTRTQAVRRALEWGLIDI